LAQSFPQALAILSAMGGATEFAVPQDAKWSDIFAAI